MFEQKCNKVAKKLLGESKFADYWFPFERLHKIQGQYYIQEARHDDFSGKSRILVIRLAMKIVSEISLVRICNL